MKSKDTDALVAQAEEMLNAFTEARQHLQEVKSELEAQMKEISSMISKVDQALKLQQNIPLMSTTTHPIPAPEEQGDFTNKVIETPQEQEATEGVEKVADEEVRDETAQEEMQELATETDEPSTEVQPTLLDEVPEDASTEPAEEVKVEDDAPEEVSEEKPRAKRRTPARKPEPKKTEEQDLPLLDPSNDLVFDIDEEPPF